MKANKLLVFTQKNCPNCPVAKKSAEKVGEELHIPVEVIDITELPEELEFELLKNQIYIASTPAIVAVEENNMRVLVLGDPVSYEELKSMLIEG
ncbi:MAG: glutaredoxin family protein [Candidatus Freyarchaeota archaeon]|nr:glutaredoxin family protein [Candidatus Jordarchaeia archaeon]